MPSEGFLPSDGILLQMIGCRGKSVGIFRPFVGFLPPAMKTERARYHGFRQNERIVFQYDTGLLNGIFGCGLRFHSDRRIV